MPIAGLFNLYCMLILRNVMLLHSVLKEICLPLNTILIIEHPNLTFKDLELTFDQKLSFITDTNYVMDDGEC